MTLNENKPGHQKHTQLVRPTMGAFGRCELAILGTVCGNIKKLASAITQQLATNIKVAYVDADHTNANSEQTNKANTNTFLGQGAYLEYTNKISYHRFDYQRPFNAFEQKAFFQKADLILINGNHFPGQAQIIVIDPAKPLEKKLDKLTNVKLIILQDQVTEIPTYIQEHVADLKTIPVLQLSQVSEIIAFVHSLYAAQVPPVHGLVLAGGKSTRMQQDKGKLQYYPGQDQRTHVFDLLQPLCEEVYVSCNTEQATELAGKLPYLEDTFLNLGPKGGILSAFQRNPNVAWLAVACDLPFLSAATLQYLVQHRDPTQMATAFYDSDGQFPEPLLTIWEPRSYATLLHFLSLGYSCPRKALINSDVKLLHIPNKSELRNVNDPETYRQSLEELTAQTNRL